MDGMYCRLMRKESLRAELGIALKTLERRIRRGEYTIIKEMSNRVWVVESEVKPEHFTKLQVQVRDLAEAATKWEQDTARYQRLYTTEQNRHREAKARVKQLEPENNELKSQARRSLEVAQAAEAEAATARQEAEEQGAADAALIEQMAATHQQELDKERKKHQKQLDKVTRSSRYWYKQGAQDTETKAQRQIVTRTWAGLLVGATVCGCVTTGLALLLG